MTSATSSQKRVTTARWMWWTTASLLAVLAFGVITGCGQGPSPSPGAARRTAAPTALIRSPQDQKAARDTAAAADDTPQSSTSGAAASDSSPRLPRLLDLGASKCIPCKKMAPILEELKKEYAGSMEVVFIDVWQDPSMAIKYGIEAIPTQIFFDASGKELFRHEGFYSKEEILAKWTELGVTLTKAPAQPGS